MCNKDFLNRLVSGEKIIEVGAKPRESNRPNESTKFEAFKKVTKEKLTTVTDLVEIAGAGVAHRKDAEARKTYAEGQRAVEEAKKIAAEKDNEAEKGRWDNVEQKNRVIDDIFRSNQDPIAQKMKLVNYFRNDPNILEEFEHVQELLKQLSYQSNCVVQLPNDQLLLETEELSEKTPEADRNKKE